MMQMCVSSRKEEAPGSTTLTSGEALREAAQAGSSKFVKKALGGGGDIIDSTDKDGWTALMLAAANGHGKTVSTLLAYQPGLDIVTKRGWSALMHAAVGNHPKIVSALLKAGASTDLRTKRGETAMSLAYDVGYKKVLSLLPSYTPKPLTPPPEADPENEKKPQKTAAESVAELQATAVAVSAAVGTNAVTATENALDAVTMNAYSDIKAAIENETSSDNAVKNSSLKKRMDDMKLVGKEQSILQQLKATQGELQATIKNT